MLAAVKAFAEVGGVITGEWEMGSDVVKAAESAVVGAIEAVETAVEGLAEFAIGEFGFVGAGDAEGRVGVFEFEIEFAALHLHADVHGVTLVGPGAGRVRSVATVVGDHLPATAQQLNISIGGRHIAGVPSLKEFHLADLSAPLAQ